MRSAMVSPMRGLVLAVILVSASSCARPETCSPRTVVEVPTRPPGPLPEVMTGPPAEGMDWIRGDWAWDGVRWVWVPGHWATPPKRGTRWFAGEIHANEEGKLVWTAGGYGCSRDLE